MYIKYTKTVLAVKQKDMGDKTILNIKYRIAHLVAQIIMMTHNIVYPRYHIFMMWRHFNLKINYF